MSKCCWWCWSPGGCAAGCCPRWGCSNLSYCLASFGTWCNPELYRHKAALRGLDLANMISNTLTHHHPGILVFFQVHHYLDKRSLSVIKYVSGSERGEAVGSALVPVINVFLSVHELQFCPRKCIGDSKLYKKLGNVFTSFRKSSAGEQALVYLQCQNKKVVSDGPSSFFSTVFQGNGQDNISYG